jgi:hypothetical protein
MMMIDNGDVDNDDWDDDDDDRNDGDDVSDDVSLDGQHIYLPMHWIESLYRT